MASYIVNFLHSEKMNRKRTSVPQSEGVINTTCNKNITLSESNSYYPEYSQAIWVNCCDDNDSDPSQCQPVQTYQSACPEGYYSCANSNHHAEMCSVEYFDSQDGSGVHGYGDRGSRTMQQKCCPQQFSCGGSFDAPCIYIGGEEPATILNSAILTNPMYLEKIGVYPGCDEKGISPAAVGAVVAIVIIAICAIGGLLLWLVKKRLHRSPIRKSARQRRRSFATEAARAKAADIEYAGSDIGTVSTRDEHGGDAGAPPKEHRGLMPSLSIAKSKSKSKDRSKSRSAAHYEMNGDKPNKSDGEFGAVHLDPQLATRVLDFAGITVTREIQIVREHGNGSSTPSQLHPDSFRAGDGYSLSSRSATSLAERGYDREPAPLVQSPANAYVRPVSLASSHDSLSRTGQDNNHNRSSSKSAIRHSGPPF